nr:MAG TPA: hypothetical protein [Caudoviricetes sp.]
MVTSLRSVKISKRHITPTPSYPVIRIARMFFLHYSQSEHPSDTIDRYH